MDKVKIHVLRCGMVRTTRWLPFNKEHVSMAKVAGLFVPAKDWEWLPVSCYYIEHPKGKILVDTAWSRRMSPDGVEDRQAQMKSLQWIKEMSMSDECVESLATHDPNVKPHIVELPLQ